MISRYFAVRASWIVSLLAYAMGCFAIENIDYQQQAFVVNGETFQVRMPTGYKLELLTADLVQPRLFAFDGKGNLVIGSKSGSIYRLTAPYKQAELLLSLSDYPHSVAFRKNQLIIARSSGYHV